MAKFSIKTWLKGNLGATIAGGLVVAVLSLLLSLLWSLNGDFREMKGALSGFAKQLDGVSSDVTGLKGDVASLRRQLDFLNGEFVAQRLATAAQEPQNPQSVREAKSILTGLREKKVKLDLSAIESAGSKLITASYRSDEAWGVVGKLLDYRSFLAEEDISSLGKLTRIPEETSSYRFNINPVGPAAEGPNFQIMQVGGLAPPEQSARLEQLSARNPTGSGVRTIVVEGYGHGLSLDDTRMEHVVVRNAKIFYNGGPIRLVDVRFVDCEFFIARSTPAVELAKVLLRPAAATYSSAEG